MKDFKFLKGPMLVQWRSANGEIKNIQDLGIRHINNILNCLNGHGDMRIPNPYFGRTHLEWCEILLRERDSRLRNI
jgi:hypothetical protein